MHYFFFSLQLARNADESSNSNVSRNPVPRILPSSLEIKRKRESTLTGEKVCRVQSRDQPQPGSFLERGKENTLETRLRISKRRVIQSTSQVCCEIRCTGVARVISSANNLATALRFKLLQRARAVHFRELQNSPFQSCDGCVLSGLAFDCNRGWMTLF